jgi:phosphatidylserine/phosphatidylglycerophosphate/cardiolipin synthase-like enzyme
MSGSLQPEVAKIEAHFEENRDRIIQEIRKAKFLIWVAVAWLTDIELLRELRIKKEQGLNIQIVTQDDVINSGLKPHVQRFFDAHYKAPRGAYKNLMHHKFCIIDLRTVVHGSYNWTVKAQYNEETVTVNHSADFAAEFAETFMKLKKATDNDAA